MNFRQLQKDPIKYTVLLFLVGACARFDVNLIARFALSELLLIAYFPIALFNIQHHFQIKQVRISTILCFVYLAGISITDYYVGNFFELYIRGAARPVIIGILFISFLDLTIRAPKGLPFFFAGLVVAGLQNFFYNVDFRADFAVAGTYRDVAYRYTPLVLASAFFGGYLISRVSIPVAGFIYISTGVIFSQFGTRTSSILLVATGFILITYKFLQARGIHRAARINFKSLIKYCSIGAILLIGVIYAYTYAAPRGVLGERVQSKFEDQAQTVFGESPLGILLRGRPHILSNLLMMREKPILGHGSWPIEAPYLIEAISILGENVNPSAINQAAFGRGVGHSIIMGGASSHGIIGLAYWTTIFYFIIKTLFYYLRFETRYSLLMVPLLIQLSIIMWLTPLGTYDRMIISIGLAHYCLIYGLNRNYFISRLPVYNLLVRQDNLMRRQDRKAL
jgi:hypothetical protein